MQVVQRDRIRSPVVENLIVARQTEGKNPVFELNNRIKWKSLPDRINEPNNLI